MEDSHLAVEEYTDHALSAIHHALRASRRRLIVGLVAHRTITSRSDGQGRETLTGHNLTSKQVVTVRRLSKEIVTLEEDVSLDHATGDPYHNVYTALIQTHLPKLDDVGAVEYDSDRKAISPDQNLVALAMVAAISSPVAQMLFHDAVADLQRKGELGRQDSITD